MVRWRTRQQRLRESMPCAPRWKQTWPWSRWQMRPGMEFHGHMAGDSEHQTNMGHWWNWWNWWFYEWYIWWYMMIYDDLLDMLEWKNHQVESWLTCGEVRFSWEGMTSSWKPGCHCCFGSSWGGRQHGPTCGRSECACRWRGSRLGKGRGFDVGNRAIRGHPKYGMPTFPG